MARFVWLVAWVVACGAASAAGTRGSRVSLDVDEVELAQVVQRLAEAGGPRLAAHADAAKLPVCFVGEGLSRGAVARWLCRSCRLVVVKQKNQLVIGRPGIDEAKLKEYKVAKVAPTQPAAAALVAFLRRVVLGAYQNRQAGEDGELEPQLEVTCAAGRLKVLAPPMVHREVLALLRAMVQAKRPLSYEELRVRYEPHELGFLGARGRVPPRLAGDVALDLADVTAAEAARELTRASKASFFIDPWDDELAKARVTLKAERLPVGVAAEKVAKQMSAERVFFDGASVFVRPARKPIFESLVVRVYNVSGSILGQSVAEEGERRAKALELPENLPYSVDRVGEKLLAAMPGPQHRQLEQILRLASAAGRLPRR